MKKNLTLLLSALALAGCESAKYPPHQGGMGEYGFTYDLDHSPSPFLDTSYRPLTIRDMSAPIMVTATNQVAVNLINQGLA